jgi:hypothetical protein
MLITAGAIVLCSRLVGTLEFDRKRPNLTLTGEQFAPRFLLSAFAGFKPIVYEFQDCATFPVDLFS